MSDLYSRIVVAWKSLLQADIVIGDGVTRERVSEFRRVLNTCSPLSEKEVYLRDFFSEIVSREEVRFLTFIQQAAMQHLVLLCSGRMISSVLGVDKKVKIRYLRSKKKFAVSMKESLIKTPNRIVERY